MLSEKCGACNAEGFIKKSELYHPEKYDEYDAERVVCPDCKGSGRAHEVFPDDELFRLASTLTLLSVGRWPREERS